jgi:hypothetical protein
VTSSTVCIAFFNIFFLCKLTSVFLGFQQHWGAKERAEEGGDEGRGSTYPRLEPQVCSLPAATMFNKCHCDPEERIYDEPNTGDVWWEVDVSCFKFYSSSY